MLNRIFQQPAVDNGFIEWVDRNLPAVKRVFDGKYVKIIQMV